MTSNFALEPPSAPVAPVHGPPTPLGVHRAQARALAAGRLRERISGGHLAPGTKLSEHVIAQELGVSRNTLREAFTMLAEESLVDRVPNRGVFVAHPTAGDVREIYNARRIIEPGHIPVFWACGVTPQAAVMECRPQFAISHAPGHMLITDAKDSDYQVP